MGESWNSGDSRDIYGVNAQHVFSGVDDQIAAVVFRTGGIDGHLVKLLLTQRDSRQFCTYILGTDIPSMLTLYSVRDIFRPGRREGSPKPDCQPQSLRN